MIHIAKLAGRTPVAKLFRRASSEPASADGWFGAASIDTGQRARCLVISWCVAASGLLHQGVAHGEPIDLVFIKDSAGDAPGDAAEAIDAQLLGALRARQPARQLYVSPVGYLEVQLAVGCGDETPACLTEIARTAEASALVIRRLDTDRSGVLRVRLLYFDQTVGRLAAHAELAARLDDTPEQLERAMSSAIDRLLGIRDTPVAAEPTAHSAASLNTDATSQRHATVAPATWLVLGTGAALTAAGVALAVSANTDYAEFRRSVIDTRAEADRARRDFSSIETRGTWSTVLIPAGVIAMGIGGVLLGVDLATGDDSADSRPARAFVAPLHGGGVLGVQGMLDR
jgi:hypothetical protein